MKPELLERIGLTKFKIPEINPKSIAAGTTGSARTLAGSETNDNTPVK